MNDNDRLTLINKLILMIESYHKTMGKRLSMEEKQIVYQCNYDEYDYMQDSILKPVSVYNLMYKAFNEICNGIIQLTHQSPYYNEYEKTICALTTVLTNNKIEHEKLLIGTTPFYNKYIGANTKLSEFTSGNMQFLLADLAKLLFSF